MFHAGLTTTTTSPKHCRNSTTKTGCNLYNSQSSIKGTQNKFSSNNIVQEIQKKISDITFTWIPSNNGIEENEKADHTAKKVNVKRQNESKYCILY